MEVNKVRKFVNILRVIYISFSLASRTRIDAVIVRKYLLLWWSLCDLEVTFYSLT